MTGLRGRSATLLRAWCAVVPGTWKGIFFARLFATNTGPLQGAFMWGFGLRRVCNFDLFLTKKQKGCELLVFTPFSYWNLYEQFSFVYG